MIIKVTINGREYEVSDNDTILNVCQKLDIFVPHLCYLKGVAPSGICGLCVVEVDGKEVLSCCTKIKNDMNIITESPRLNSIRKLNIDRLLKHHYIDCFNCSKSGACVLQKYASRAHSNIEPIDSNKNKSEIVKLYPGLYYDKGKCVNCLRCVRFLNAFCGYSLKQIGDLNIKKDKSGALLNVLDICPTNALFEHKQDMHVFLCDKVEAIDLNDVFTPKIALYKRDNEVQKVGAVDSYISDKTRQVLCNLPIRQLPENYSEIIDKLSRCILSGAHEKNLFVFGDTSDLASFCCLKALAQKFDNIHISVNDFGVPRDIPYEFGLRRSDMISMDFAFFFGVDSAIDELRFTLHSDRKKDSEILSSENLSKVDDIFNDKYFKYDFPYLIVYPNVFRQFSHKSVLKKIANFEQKYLEKYKKKLEVRILPRNLSQMILKNDDDYVSVDNLLTRFNKHDIQSLCVVGDLDYNLHIPEDVFAVSNSVFPIKNAEHVPSKHFVEDSRYYINVFGELIESKAVIHSKLKSNRDFLFDLMKRVFKGSFESVYSEIQEILRTRL